MEKIDSIDTYDEILTHIRLALKDVIRGARTSTMEALKRVRGLERTWGLNRSISSGSPEACSAASRPVRSGFSNCS